MILLFSGHMFMEITHLYPELFCSFCDSSTSYLEVRIIQGCIRAKALVLFARDESVYPNSLIYDSTIMLCQVLTNNICCNSSHGSKVKNLFLHVHIILHNTCQHISMYVLGYVEKFESKSRSFLECLIILQLDRKHKRIKLMSDPPLLCNMFDFLTDDGLFVLSI